MEQLLPVGPLGVLDDKLVSVVAGGVLFNLVEVHPLTAIAGVDDALAGRDGLDL